MRSALAATVALVATALAAPAGASFSADQAADLARGTSIVEPVDYGHGDHRFVGGVSYLVVDDDVAHLSSIARDVTRFRELLPNVVDARLVSIAPSGKAKVRVVHAVGPMRGAYTLDIAFSEEGRVGRFYLDKKADNSIDDAWGFVRFTPLSGGKRTLVTWGVLFDLGPGILRSMFESRIRRAALSYPSRLANAAKH